MRKSRVIVVGGGFGGLKCVKSLKNTNFDIILIDKKNHHLFQPLLYQVATASLSPADIAVPLREIFYNQCNTTILMGDVQRVNLKKKQVFLQNGDMIRYDYLVLAPGTHHSYFGHAKWGKSAPGLKTLTDALTLRENILLSFEKAERLWNKKKVLEYLNFVIIGAGPTGVELAGAIAEISRKTLYKSFRYIYPEQSNIYLIEGSDTVLPAYPKELSMRAVQDLKNLGVKVLTGTRVIDIKNNTVKTNLHSIRTRNIIWAAGNEAPELLKTLHVPLDKQGRVLVNSDLSIPGFSNAFVIGDAAAYKYNDTYLPGVAPVAIQMGIHVAKILKCGKKSNRPDFVYRDKGTMSTIGRGKAIAYVGKIYLSGFFAWISWLAVHIVYLIGFRNRFSVIVQWVSLYLLGRRSARLIHRSIEDELPKKTRRSKRA